MTESKARTASPARPLLPTETTGPLWAGEERYQGSAAQRDEDEHFGAAIFFLIIYLMPVFPNGL